MLFKYSKASIEQTMWHTYHWATDPCSPMVWLLAALMHMHSLSLSQPSPRNTSGVLHLHANTARSLQPTVTLAQKFAVQL